MRLLYIGYFYSTDFKGNDTRVIRFFRCVWDTLQIFISHTLKAIRTGSRLPMLVLRIFVSYILKGNRKLLIMFANVFGIY